MINITPECLQKLKDDVIQFARITVEPLTGSKIEITEKDIPLGGLSIETHCVDGETLQIGNLTSAVLTLKLDNSTGKYNGVFFAGARLFVEIGIPLEEFKSGTPVEKIKMKWVPKGEYTVDEQPRSLAVIEIEAFDNVVKLDKPFDSNMYPTCQRQLVMEGIDAAGLKCADYSMFNEDWFCNEPPTSENSVPTWRQVIMWCCQIDGVCGFADEYGNIKFKWYKEIVDGIESKPKFTISESDRFQGSLIDEQDTVITGHQFIVDKTKYPETVEDSSYLLQTTDNLVFANTNDAWKDHYGRMLNQKEKCLKGFKYRGFSCDCLSYIMLQPLDQIYYEKEGKKHETIITNITFTLNGKMSIAAKALSQQAKGYASLGALTSSQKAIIDNIRNEIDLTNKDITDREKALLQLNEIMNGAKGFYEETVIENGQKTYYKFDEPTKEKSKVIYKSNMGGTVWTTSGWNNGNPVWQYGSTTDGDAILNTIHTKKLLADDITTGTIRSKNNGSWINMDNGEFQFSSLEVDWVDLDTGNITYKPKPVLKLNKGNLQVDGELVSMDYPNIKLKIGPNEDGDREALTCFSGTKRLFEITEMEGGVVWSVYGIPADGNEWDYYKSILFEPYGIHIRTEDSASVFLEGNGCDVVACGNSLEISNRYGNVQWINFGSSHNNNTVTEFHFGNCTWEGYSSLYAASFVVSSNRKLKENISEILDNASLDKIKALKFYSYDYKNTVEDNTKATNAKQRSTKTPEQDNLVETKPLHIDIGLMADEAPSEIQSQDGKAIDLYSYISLTAKAVQELTAEVENLKLEIIKLKEEK